MAVKKKKTLWSYYLYWQVATTVFPLVLRQIQFGQRCGNMYPICIATHIPLYLGAFTLEVWFIEKGENDVLLHFSSISDLVTRWFVSQLIQM